MKNEQYWREFLRELQRETSISHTPAHRRRAYDKAFEIISKPQNTISCMSVKDMHLRIELIRHFPFIAFKKNTRAMSKIIRDYL